MEVTLAGAASYHAPIAGMPTGSLGTGDEGGSATVAAKDGAEKTINSTAIAFFNDLSFCYFIY
jgi:hypothetical protein